MRLISSLLSGFLVFFFPAFYFRAEQVLCKPPRFFANVEILSVLVVFPVRNWDTWRGCCNWTVTENLCASVCGTKHAFFFGEGGGWSSAVCSSELLIVFENGPEIAVKVAHHGLCSACRWVSHNRRSYAKSPTYIISATGFSTSCLLWVCLSLPPLIPSSTLLFFTPSVFHPLPSPRSHPHSLFSPCAVIFFDRSLFAPTSSHTAHRHWWRDLSRSGFLPSLILSLAPPLCLSPYFSPAVSISTSLPPSFIIISSHLHITEASVIFAVRRRIFSLFLLNYTFSTLLFQLFYSLWMRF